MADPAQTESQIESVGAVLTPEIAAITADVRAWLEASAEFTREQAPLLINEVLRFAVIDETTGAIWSLLVSGAVIGSLVYSFRRYMSWTPRNDDAHFVAVLGLLLGVVVSVSSIVYLMSSMLSVVKIIVAPRLYLIEYFSRMVD